MSFALVVVSNIEFTITSFSNWRFGESLELVICPFCNIFNVTVNSTSLFPELRSAKSTLSSYRCKCPYN